MNVSLLRSLDHAGGRIGASSLREVFAHLLGGGTRAAA
jgi:hypothetical protein